MRGRPGDEVRARASVMPVAFPGGIARDETCCSIAAAFCAIPSSFSSRTPAGAGAPVWQVWQRSATIA